mgnify:CR=1 FL=1
MVVKAWVTCTKCGGAKHRILRGKKTPQWFCQDVKYQLEVGQEIDVEDVKPIEPELIIAS